MGELLHSRRGTSEVQFGYYAGVHGLQTSTGKAMLRPLRHASIRAWHVHYKPLIMHKRTPPEPSPASRVLRQHCLGFPGTQDCGVRYVPRYRRACLPYARSGRAGPLFSSTSSSETRVFSSTLVLDWARLGGSDFPNCPSRAYGKPKSLPLSSCRLFFFRCDCDADDAATPGRAGLVCAHAHAPQHTTEID